MDKKSNATKFCMNCGKELAFNAKACPQCGYDCKPKKPFYKRIYFWLIIGIFFGAGIVSSEKNNSPNNNQKEIQTTNSFQETDKDTPTPKQYLEITSDKLIEEVETNALKAQDNYEGKNVAVTGKLTSIDSDGKYIILGSISDKITLKRIRCYIPSSNSEEIKEQIKNFNTNEKIIVKGTITDVGDILGYSLTIDECNKS